MSLTACLFILAFILAAGLLLTGWHIVVGILHLGLWLVHVLFRWPALLIMILACVAISAIFMR